MDVMKTCASLCLLLTLTTAAPLQPEADSLKPLVRTKRGDESFLRNILPKDVEDKTLLDKDEYVIDKNTESLNLPRLNSKSHDENTPEDDVIEETEDKMVVESPNGITVTDKVKEEEDETKTDTRGKAEGEDDEKVNSDVEMQIQRLPDNGGLVVGEKEEADDEEMKEVEGSGDLDTDPFELPSGVPNEPREFSDYYDYNYPELYRKKRSAKRSIKPMTAESMNSVVQPAKSMRVKRDLTEDELRDWLEKGASQEELYYPDYEEESPSSEDKYYNGYEDYEEMPSWTNQDLEDIIGGETPWGYQSEEPTVERALTDESTDVSRPYGEQDGTKDRLALLQYLLMDADPQEEQEEEAYMEGLSPESVRESWEELEAPQADYQPVVYHGVPGVFIPTSEAEVPAAAPVEKRQLLSLVPGMRKRNFYPYNYEPSGGRWGAFVPSEEKRNEEQYSRLMRMAAALNGGASRREWRRK